ncbi:hypothetical protein GGR52DRAFT_510048 [Hypoxylon sp. FL1284]|nr:hypothetical protein GGR52DRAFT_510048 [Hypoxylon sp. FL1284]
MDLDPSNVLVGECRGDKYDMEHHGWNMIAKIADFGLMVSWNDEWTPEDKTRMLRRGKQTWLTPEQREPARIIESGESVDYKMNVWGIGLIMLNILSLGHPDGSDGWVWVPEMRKLNFADPRQPPDEREVLTWGSLLVGDLADGAKLAGGSHRELLAAYDESLRAAIARCMCDSAADRPSLATLLDIIWTGILRFEVNSFRTDFDPAQELADMVPPPVETDRLLDKFYADYFLEPRNAGDPYADYWARPAPDGDDGDGGGEAPQQPAPSESSSDSLYN